jgi:hypothetical protein
MFPDAGKTVAEPVITGNADAVIAGLKLQIFLAVATVTSAAEAY